MTPMCRSKYTDEDGDSETVIEKFPPPPPPKTKTFFAFFVMDPENPHATKSEYNVKNVSSVLTCHVECLPR